MSSSKTQKIVALINRYQSMTEQINNMGQALNPTYQNIRVLMRTVCETGEEEETLCDAIAMQVKSLRSGFGTHMRAVQPKIDAALLLCDQIIGKEEVSAEERAAAALEEAKAFYNEAKAEAEEAQRIADVSAEALRNGTGDQSAVDVLLKRADELKTKANEAAQAAADAAEKADAAAVK